MAFEFALISKVQSVSRAFGQDALLQFHRQAGILSTVLILVHAVLMFDESNSWAMRWGALAAYAVLLLIVLSVGRRRLRISYDWWYLTHAPLAEAAVLFSLVHLVMFAGFSSTVPIRALLAVYAALMLGLRVWFVILKPFRMWSRPWEVVENLVEYGDSRTLVLRPVGHSGFTFEPGQFAWMITGPTPFHRDKHPISMSSCAYDELGKDIGFTIKNMGDWSGQLVPAIKPGTRVWLDGPYGAFTPGREQGFGYFLIGGGVGITPLYSMCRTLAERGDARPVVLVFGALDRESLTFFDQGVEAADELAGRLRARKPAGGLDGRARLLRPGNAA